MDPYSSQNYYQQQYPYQQGASGSTDYNPYHQPYQGPMYPIPGSSTSAHNAPVPANAYEYDVGIVAQQSAYVPGATIDKRGGAGGKLAKGGKRTTVLRKGGGKVWEDQTLLEWNPCTSTVCIVRPVADFRLQLGSASSWAISATTCPMTCYPTPSASMQPSQRRGSFETGSVAR